LFDHAGAVAGVMTVMGSAGLIDTRLDGPVALTLSARADEVSRRMGWA
jgi:DNA-binding IclR family transcriptional regulator